MKKLLFIFSVAALVAAFQNAEAQNFVWAKQFGGTSTDIGESIAVDASGNVYTTGYFQGTADFDPGPATFNLTSAGMYDVFVTKLSPSGNLVWARQLGGTLEDLGISIKLDAAGNVYITGIFKGTVDFGPGPATFNLTSAGRVDVFIIKLDTLGNLVWAKQLGGSSIVHVQSMAVDAAGNIYATGYFDTIADFDPGPAIFNLTSVGGAFRDIFIIKLDASGNLVWVKQLGGFYYDVGNSIAVDASGMVYATGEFAGPVDFDPGPATFILSTQNGIGGYTYDDYIIKLDALGNLVWAKQLIAIKIAELTIDAVGNVYATGGFRFTPDFDLGPATFNLTSAGGYDVFVTKLSPSGNLVWAKQFGDANDDNGYSIAVDDNGMVYVTGNFDGTADFDPGPAMYYLTSAGNDDIFITKLNGSGNLVWAKQFGGANDDSGKSLVVDTAENVFATGAFRYTTDFDPDSETFNLTSAGERDIFILKLARPFVIEGNLFQDVNANCSRDTAEIVLAGFLVKAEPGPRYGFTDSAGNYTIYLDSGTYDISLATEDMLWQQTCTTSYSVQLSGAPDTTIGVNFAMQSAYFCPRLTVDLVVPSLRRCFSSTYTISYSNTGTLPASNVYIEVDFGHYLQPQSSTIPWSTVSGNVYTFQIGNLGVGRQGSFNVTAYLDCNAQRGSTQCVTAHIYPDSLCIPPLIGWDKSETAVSGTCVNDSLVCFTVKNRSAAGSGDMAGAAQWRLYVNDTLVTQDTYQLAGGDSVVKCYPASGKTYRLEADQNLPHPRRSKPQAIIEACGSPTVFGFVNTVPQDDEELAVETFCMTVIGSFDPNDKQVSPIGITSNKYITADDELEYLIRFQNTGTDTAFKVVIRDTIATDVLDIATLVSGASSHDYTFNIYGQGIAEWTFDNILLPDSFVNEPASHGFVQFKIKQLPGNADGTLIENRAAIYFDFNAPVITNTAWNEVNEGNMPQSFLSAAIGNATDISCHGDSNGVASISATGGLPPYQFAWSNGATDATASNLLAGNYFITVTDAAENVWTDSVSIAEPALLETAIASQTNVLCFGDGTGTATATATGGTTPYTYEWSHQGSAFATATSLNAGVYSVTVWDAHLCTATTSSVTITEPTQLTTLISTQSGVSCFGGNDASAKANPAGGVFPYAAEWSDGQTGFTANDLSAGNYQVTVADSNGCELVTSVTIQDALHVNIGGIQGPDTIYDISQNITYSVNSDTGYTYEWTFIVGFNIQSVDSSVVVLRGYLGGPAWMTCIATGYGCADTVSKSVFVFGVSNVQDNGLSDIALYPNPTNGTITLKTANINSIASLKLYDSIGKELLQQTATPLDLQQGILLDLKEMIEGVYFLSIKTEGGTRVMKVVRY